MISTSGLRIFSKSTIDSYQRSCLCSPTFRWFVPACKPPLAQAAIVHRPSTVDYTQYVRTSASLTSMYRIRILADHVDQSWFVRSFVPSRSFHLSSATSTDQGNESASDTSKESRKDFRNTNSSDKDKQADLVWMRRIYFLWLIGFFSLVSLVIVFYLYRFSFRGGPFRGVIGPNGPSGPNSPFPPHPTHPYKRGFWRNNSKGEP